MNFKEGSPIFCVKSYSDIRQWGRNGLILYRGKIIYERGGYENVRKMRITRALYNVGKGTGEPYPLGTTYAMDMSTGTNVEYFNTLLDAKRALIDKIFKKKDW